MNLITPIVNARTIFGHSPISDNFLDRDLPNFSDIEQTRTVFSSSETCITKRYPSSNCHTYEKKITWFVDPLHDSLV